MPARAGAVGAAPNWQQAAEAFEAGDFSKLFAFAEFTAERGSLVVGESGVADVPAMYLPAGGAGDGIVREGGGVEGFLIHLEAGSDLLAGGSDR
jgi:hypothetical protein